jgi:hypothetical protein
VSSIASQPPVTEWPVTAYGLNIRGPESLFPALPAALGHEDDVELQRAGSEELASIAAGGTVSSSPAHERARGFDVIELEDGSQLLDAPEIGLAHISVDGTRVAYAAHGDDPRWRLLVMAQALPAAAALQGFESLHAAAVALPGGGCIAIAAPSGVGKTSVTTELLLHGDTVLVADDVLTLKPSSSGDGLLAQPGPAWLSVRADHETRLGHGAELLGPITRFASKSYHTVVRQSGPLPLTGIYALERVADGPGAIASVERPSLPSLMRMAFVRHIAEQHRRRGLFETCAALAATTPLFSVRIPPEWDAAATADAIRAHDDETRRRFSDPAEIAPRIERRHLG